MELQNSDPPVQIWVAPPKIDEFRQKFVDFTFYIFTIHSALTFGSIFGREEVRSNSEEVWEGHPHPIVILDYV